MLRILILFIICLNTSLFAQTIGSNPTPGTYNIGGGSNTIGTDFLIDWSIGESSIIESFVGKFTTDNLLILPYSFVTSGVLQPMDLFHIPILPIESLLLDEVRIYPVPAKNYVNLDFRSGDMGNLSISLFDVAGRIIETKMIIKTEKYIIQNWNISKLTSGNYYFKVIIKPNSNLRIKTGVFKMQKIN